MRPVEKQQMNISDFFFVSKQSASSTVDNDKTEEVDFEDSLIAPGDDTNHENTETENRNG